MEGGQRRGNVIYLLELLFDPHWGTEHKIFLSKYQVNHTDLWMLGVEGDNIRVWTVQGDWWGWSLLRDFSWAGGRGFCGTDACGGSGGGAEHEVRVLVKVAQSCPTLCDPVDYTVHWLLLAWCETWMRWERVGLSLPLEDLCVFHAELGTSILGCSRKNHCRV